MKIKIIHTSNSIKSSIAFQQLEEEINKFIETKDINVIKIKLKKNFKTAAIYYK